MKLQGTKSPDGAHLELTIEGSVDTVTAPELERYIAQECAGVTELVMDFAGVDYVSSAGLRVIMGAEQRMEQQGKLVLKNVSDEVHEVFEMTGFDELLNFG